MNIKKAYNFKEVNDSVSCSGTLKRIDLESFRNENYDVVINLLPNDSEHAIINEKASIEALGIHYVYIPIDWDAPTETDLNSFESAMRTFKNKKIHIHCAANYRVTAFYALYANRNEGWSNQQVSEFIGSIWTITDFPVWNKFLTEQLKT